MNSPVDIERSKYELALKVWQADCRQRMAQRYPTIPYDADRWSLKGITVNDSPDFIFTAILADFADKHSCFAEALRCLIAEAVLREKIKRIDEYASRIRQLRLAPVDSLFDLDNATLRNIETTALKRARSNPSYARIALMGLDELGRTLDTFAAKGILPHMRYRMKSETRSELLELKNTNLANSHGARATVFDRKIEALNEAFNALFANDARLTNGDRIALATMGLMLCAPSRINETLCMSIDDYVRVDDYARRVPNKESDTLHMAHQMLLITMKGSKGAEWSAKPVLNFMIDFFNYCLEIILEHGKRSRMLVQWYRLHPDRLYLPPELEHLRGTNLTLRSLGKIMNMSDSNESYPCNPAQQLMVSLGSKRFKVPNPNPHTKTGKKHRFIEVDGARWDDIEPLLLANVHTEMEKCRIVTATNYYKGDLEKMLFLFDHVKSPYLPGTAKYQFIASRLKKQVLSKQGKLCNLEPSLFEKLNIMMPVNGVTQFAEINPHDPRRWLTTMALTYGEKLSDVLINKWANRLSIAHLWHYDFRSMETKAAVSAMPEPVELIELSNGLTACRKLEDKYGPKIDIVSVHDAGISGTTMDAISFAVEDRPLARTGEQIIIIYPTWYGFCAHQHHEKPCRAYSSCLPCNNNHLVKGHIPTNDRTRERADELHAAILNVVEQIMIIHGRDIADDQQTLTQHLFHLIESGLNPSQMTDELISRFHEIKHLVKDTVLKNMLHEAFVATGYVERLDNPIYTNGALMKYHNPTHHAAPGLERALDAHGGHERIEQEQLAMIEKYPQFAPTIRGLKDQGSLISPDGDNNESDNSEDDKDE
ncbi:hypothetical protein D0U00_17150 [Leclercia adecarboxylata]|uniref:hypothetical protein n=1 Tax=Leclercia adecarboxylata TaxID=83655 RepID=UPI000E3D0582|nr:hypothetical protein [Leclercia adecarboxylata]RFS77881.1 hypothetical protein D0U00_17150 [Leclercia adecarboxylata]